MVSDAKVHYLYIWKRFPPPSKNVKIWY